MYVHVDSHDFRLSQSLRALATKRLTWAVRHGGRQVRQVEAWIDLAGDANKRCLIVVQLLPTESRTFESVATDAASAVDIAAASVENWLRPAVARTALATVNSVSGRAV